VRQRCRGQQAIDYWDRVLDVETTPYLGYISRNGHNPIAPGIDELSEPLLENFSLRRVPPSQPFNALSDLANNHNTQIQLTSGDRVEPCFDAGVGYLLSELRHDVGVE
jgi:hypothetical protein